VAAIAWGMVVLGLTFVILLLGAIVLPAQANEIPASANPVTVVYSYVQIYQPYRWGKRLCF
jgi:hypothetical protein